MNFRTLASLVIIFLMMGCQKSPDNSVTVVIPLPPTTLKATTLSISEISLSWTDNSTNEDGFVVERKIGLGSFSLLASTAADKTSYKDTLLAPNTTYIYRVSAFNNAGKSLTYSNIDSATTKGLPTLSNTTLVSNITNTNAQSGGNITKDGGSAITARGVCWSTTTNPTIANSKTIDGTGIGNFTSLLTGLSAITNYYIRSYATNSIGTVYGSQLNFTTGVVTIGTQVWMNMNLDVTTYRNGDVIPEVKDATQWDLLTTGAWCWYKGASVYGSMYGRLYNGYAVTDPRGLAPLGWHIPTDAEWTTLGTFLGGDAVAGGKMMATGTSMWAPPNTSATNTSGFSGLPGGYGAKNANAPNSGISFSGESGSSNWWSATESNLNILFIRWLLSNEVALITGKLPKNNMYSVRCIKD